jgi:hypothetical protein
MSIEKLELLTPQALKNCVLKQSRAPKAKLCKNPHEKRWYHQVVPPSVGARLNFCSRPKWWYHRVVPPSVGARWWYHLFGVFELINFKELTPEWWYHRFRGKTHTKAIYIDGARAQTRKSWQPSPFPTPAAHFSSFFNHSPG